MTLHCIYAAPDSPACAGLLEQVNANDSVLFLGAAVVFVRASNGVLDAWSVRCPALWALGEDLDAYGIAELHPAIRRADYARWVALSEAHPNQLLWR